MTELYAYTSIDMPYDSSGSLHRNTYIDLIAHVLQANGFPAGNEPLGADPNYLQKLFIVKEN